MKLTTDSVDVRVTILPGGNFEICPESDVTLSALRAAARAEGLGPSFREAVQIPELLSDESKAKIAQWGKRKPSPRTDGTIVMARAELFALYGLSGAVPSLHKRARRPEGAPVPAAVSVVAAVAGQPLAPVDFEAGSGLALVGEIVAVDPGVPGLAAPFADYRPESPSLASGPDFPFDLGICDDIEPPHVPTGERFRKAGRFGDNGGRPRRAYGRLAVESLRTAGHTEAADVLAEAVQARDDADRTKARKSRKGSRPVAPTASMAELVAIPGFRLPPLRSKSPA